MNCGGNGEGGGFILPPFSSSGTLDDCEDNNDDDDVDIYKNDGITNHDYRVEDISLAGTDAGEG